MTANRSGVGLLVLLCVCTSGAGATYEVAQRHPKASDDGPGNSETPWRTLAQAARKAQAGDTVVIRSGTYREAVVVQTSGTQEHPVRFEAGPGEHVVITGADALEGWTKTDGPQPVYQVKWPHRFIGWSKQMAHPDDEYHRLVGRCEQVAVQGYLLRQVLEPGQLAPGTFFADVTNQLLHVWDVRGRDVRKLLVEASTRQEILAVKADWVEVKGLRFRFAANMAQRGAVVLAGSHDLLEDCVIEQMNSSGAAFRGEDQVVRRCVFRDNGQLGFGASHAHRLLLTDCVVEGNNTKGFDRGWEAGGNKLALCRGAVLERSRFVRNRGNGIWFDIGNEDCVVRQCLIADNEDAGIFYEISFGLKARDNVIVGNGFASTPGAWGAQAGIAISSSPGCVIERNLLVGNREGFNFREQTRETPRIDNRRSVPVWNHDELIRSNVIALNRDAQVWGWFDVKDGRHWPRKDTAQPTAAEGEKSLRLEDLQLKFVGNAYFAAPGQGWFSWGPNWARHERYAGLEEFRKRLGIDEGGQVLAPEFADFHARDFRLPREVYRQMESCLPKGPVPDVIIGQRQYVLNRPVQSAPAAARNRG